MNEFIEQLERIAAEWRRTANKSGSSIGCHVWLTHAEQELTRAIERQKEELTLTRE